MRSSVRTLSLTALTLLFTAACSEGPLGLVAPPQASEAQGGGGGRPGGGGGGGGGGAGGGFSDDFASFQKKLWLKQDHFLGRSYLSPDNVTVSGGHLLLGTPDGSTDGGEIRSRATFGYGRYEVMMAAAPAPGSMTNFFLYEPGTSPIDEIDVELLPDRNEAWFTVWKYDRVVHEARITLDVTNWHVYGIDYAPGRIGFWVDEDLVAEFSGPDIPDTEMYLMANLWWPTWMTGTAPGTQYARYDWIRATPY